MNLPSAASLAWTSVYSLLMILINFDGQPSFQRIMKRSSPLTLSNDLTKSTRAMCRHLCCSLVFFISCWSPKIPSIVLLPWRYPDCDWGYIESVSRWSLCKIASAKAFPAALSSDMPLLLPHWLLLPVLNNMVMIASVQSDGIISAVQEMLNGTNRKALKWCPPCTSISGRMPLEPGQTGVTESLIKFLFLDWVVHRIDDWKLVYIINNAQVNNSWLIY